MSHIGKVVNMIFGFVFMLPVPSAAYWSLVFSARKHYALKIPLPSVELKFDQKLVFYGIQYIKSGKTYWEPN